MSTGRIESEFKRLSSNSGIPSSEEPIHFDPLYIDPTQDDSCKYTSLVSEKAYEMLCHMPNYDDACCGLPWLVACLLIKTCGVVTCAVGAPIGLFMDGGRAINNCCGAEPHRDIVSPPAQQMF